VVRTVCRSMGIAFRGRGERTRGTTYAPANDSVRRGSEQVRQKRPAKRLARLLRKNSA
jgi:hypothetical protein